MVTISKEGVKKEQARQKHGISSSIRYRGFNIKQLLLICVFLGFVALALYYFFSPTILHKLFTYPKKLKADNDLAGKAPTDMKASVIVMNFARPRNLQESNLMPTLLRHDNIDEILILHANPNTIFNYTSSFAMHKINNIDAIEEDKKHGLAIRFQFCSEIKTPYVIILDDDVEFPSVTLDAIMIEFQKNTKRIVGRWGRTLTHWNSGLWTHGYTIVNAPYHTEVVLTKLMILETSMCRKFMEYDHVMEDFATSGPGPKWNGEDIFMSLLANHYYETELGITKHLNYAMPWLHAYNVEHIYPGGSHDINGGVRGFKPWNAEWRKAWLYLMGNLRYRGLLWKTAKTRLQQLNEKK